MPLQSSRNVDFACVPTEKLNASGIVNILTDYAHKKQLWFTLPAMERQYLMNHMEDQIFKNGDKFAVTKTIWCMGKMSVGYSYLPVQLRNAITKRLETSSNSFGTAVSIVLYGFSQMRCDWSNDISPLSRKVLLSTLSQSCRHMNEMNTINSIYALGRMQCNWNTVPVDTQAALMERTLEVVEFMGQISCANFLWLELFVNYFLQPQKCYYNKCVKHPHIVSVLQELMIHLYIGEK